MAITISGNGIVEANLADNAVTLAKMAGGTDGEILTYDASGNPVAVSVGTDGQVLTSTGAGSPPAFETAAAGGKVLQVVQYHTTSTNTISNPTGSEEIITQTFTPTSSTSEVLLIGSFGVEKGSGADGYFTPRLYRDNVGIVTTNTQVGRHDTGQHVYGHAFSYLDSPATTSQITYDLEMYSVYHANVSWNFKQRSLTLIEIGV